METISLARGVPAPECVPVEELAECARAALRDDGATILSYGAAGGYAPLRRHIAAQHGVSSQRVVLTNGSLQGFALEGGARVAYSSSFSKTVAPGIRVGYLVLPERLARAVESTAASTYITPA